MVLVDADAVEAELIGEFQLADVAAIELLADLRIEIRVRQRYPGGVVTVGVAEVQVGVGHEVEEERFHPCAPWKKALSRGPMSLAPSIGRACPVFGNETMRACLISRTNGWWQARGITRSSSPQISSVGMSMRCNQNRQLRTVQTRVPGKAREAGAVLQHDVDVELGLRRLPCVRELAVVELAAGEFLRPPGENIVDRRVPALRPGRRQQRQRSEPLRVADRHLGRGPAADAMADEVHVAQSQRLQSIEIEIGQVATLFIHRRESARARTLDARGR